MTWGSDASSTLVPSSSVIVTGNLTACDGLAAGVAAELVELGAIVAGAAEGDPPGAAHAHSRTDRMTGRATPRRRERGSTVGFLRGSWTGAGGEPAQDTQDPSLRGGR